MANRPRTRKRVHAIRRASDGSAFDKCDKCGVLVAIALADMHECESSTKMNVKRFKGLHGKQNVGKQSVADQPRSPFRLFMENFTKTCNAGTLIDTDRKGFETWRNMSKEEREPYVVNANAINSMYIRGLTQEIDIMPEEDDEADSAMVGKFDLFYEDEDSDNFYSFQYKDFDSFTTWEWERVPPWLAKG